MRLPSLAIFEQILRTQGLGVYTAATAEAALLHLDVARPTAIVIDFRLPTLDGLERLRRIRALPQCRRTPVTVITSGYLRDDQIIAEIDWRRVCV